MKSFIKTVTVPYVIYLMYFVGVGFLSGSIVHYPTNPTLYGIIGAIGAVIFTIASTLNEWVVNKRHFMEEGVLKIIFFSLVLSIGVGMISGGTQHFTDVPVYASYLIPTGIVISFVGYLFTHEVHLNSRRVLFITLKLAAVIIPLFFILNTLAKNITPTPHNDAHDANIPVENSGTTPNMPTEQHVEGDAHEEDAH